MSEKPSRKKKRIQIHPEAVLPDVKAFLSGLGTSVSRSCRRLYRTAVHSLNKLNPQTRILAEAGAGLAALFLAFLILSVPVRLIAGRSSAGSAAERVSAEGLSDEDLSTNFGLPEDGWVYPQDEAETVSSGTLAIETESSIPDFPGELHEGDRDDVVSAIQVRLMELGYMDSDEPTTYFGSHTRSALKIFQRHNDLDSDGICGEMTYNALMGEEAKSYVMQNGDSGDDVKDVQKRLYELGYLDNSANITATFGDKTEEAVRLFQKKNKLDSDGKIGSKTLSRLYEENVVGNAFKLGDEGPVIKECQKKLRELGYITFKPDGVLGKTTVSAIKAFQRANGLTVDGALGPVTRDKILSGKATAMVLQLGDYGTDVKNMQSALVKLKYLRSSGATGYFGELTEKAVKAFQKRNHLTVDGRVGGTTLAIMKSSNAKKSASGPVSLSTSKPASSSSSSSSGSSGSSSSSGSSAAAAANKSGVEKLIALAESKIGCRYVRGAKGPNTFDCSGFVYWCMRNAGVSCSYQTSVMWRSCTRYKKITSLSAAQRGDILVFSDSSDATGHVGIYLGGGKMIDASSSEGQVRMSSSVTKSGGYWPNHFICAFRIF